MGWAGVSARPLCSELLRLMGLMGWWCMPHDMCVALQQAPPLGGGCTVRPLRFCPLRLRRRLGVRRLPVGAGGKARREA